MEIGNQLAIDRHTVALYRLDEGIGEKAYDACGDESLTLRARRALWTTGERRAARFTGAPDDAELFVGPCDHPKLMLKHCPEEWTVEAWARFTGMRAEKGHTYVGICGTEDEGFGLTRKGRRGGFSFSLTAAGPEIGLAPSARFIGNFDRNDPLCDTSIGIMALTKPIEWVDERALIRDDQWHHVAWQFRDADQANFLFVDGKLVRAVYLTERPIKNDAVECGVPFVVGGMLHSQTPPFFTGRYSFVGELCQVRISDRMRYPTGADFRVLKTRLAPMYVGRDGAALLQTEAGKGASRFSLAGGALPPGMCLREDGLLSGAPMRAGTYRMETLATDAEGRRAREVFALRVEEMTISEDGLPPAFAGVPFRHALSLAGGGAARWRVAEGALPRGVALTAEGVLSGVTAEGGCFPLAIRAALGGYECEKRLTLRVLPTALWRIKPMADTVFLYDWQTEDALHVPDACGDPALRLTWVNMGGDRKYFSEGRAGRFPQETGHGEHGYVSYALDHDKHNLRTCREAWTVEAWIRIGGSRMAFGTGEPFHEGHICGTLDSSLRGVWELYVSDANSPDGSWAPGARFFGEGVCLKDLQPWARPEGCLTPPAEAGIRDTQWHHVAWQYRRADETHQLLLDGRLVWQVARPDGVSLVNDRRHDAQFSVFSRLECYCLRGHNARGQFAGGFNYRKMGNFFGQIGEIRVSSACKYGG